ncbi:uncharacterized protein Nmag_2959 [Natrialba magadii ATCC 43099]|uniref:Uncharacterized protein n=1 Tax=Natrialba magadii (strain ATCC 43099 / DSM 3394 / CCM 3739 / CIP 104546 / IAM 13178 / JCM 8861 / NBRC 102185 / NCIMB 2190 / MS3) TaxID=547559 RepID=D3T0N2_NATMM|nr:DUF5518 domain-containing protein [Natrialba magadii]ADD06511.1 uncharacterized protein Nmag_2959 [Natrialba magadii ATCC 43099]ELY32027.1 hypothetical protein C500_05598 [Natrialba magadii ATCC 43099]
MRTAPHQRVLERLTDEQLRVATLVGLLTIPFLVGLSWQTVGDPTTAVGGSISGAPILLSGFIVGYYYSDRPTPTRRASVRTGLVSSIGVLIVYLGTTYTAVLTEPVEIAIVASVLTPIAGILGVGITVVLTAVAAVPGEWFANGGATGQKAEQSGADVTAAAMTGSDHAGQTGHTAHTGHTDHTAHRSRWWLFVAAYGVIVPPALVYALVVNPEAGPGVAVAVLSMFAMVFGSVGTMLALAKDIGTLGTARTARWANWRLHVLGAVGPAALVYAAASYQGVSYPPGYAIYTFIGSVWLVAVAYLVYRHRHTGTRPKSGSPTG